MFLNGSKTLVGRFIIVAPFVKRVIKNTGYYL